MSSTYDVAGRRSTMAVAGQPVVNYSYDNANRLTQITQATSTVSFTYDAANRRTSLTLPNGVVVSYSYDRASQLAGVTYQSGATTLGNLSYAYDLAGRRSQVGGSFARTGLPNAVTTTAYNADNQLTQWGTATLTYDANGNMTSSGTDGYTWNGRNQLASTLSGANFKYDPFGRRVSKTVSGATTSFLYDGANVVQELMGGTPTANLLVGGLDEYFARTDSAGSRSFLTDALGSTLALADSTGMLQTQYTYEPFGNTTPTGPATTNSFAYTGRELDATGLYFYRARYYDPTVGRFTSEDPIGFLGGDNFYIYVLNNPVNWDDPFGLQVKVCQRPLNFKPAKKYPHTFLYSTESGTGYGLGPKSGWDPLAPLGPVPGQIEKDFPYGPDGKLKKNYSCNTVSTNSCVESCVNRKAIEQTKKPPKYKLGTYQCDTWADDILRQCKKECGQ